MADNRKVGRPPLHREEIHNVMNRNFREIAINTLEVPTIGTVIAFAGSKGTKELPVSDRTVFRVYGDITGVNSVPGGTMAGESFGVLPAVVVGSTVYISGAINPESINSLTISHPSGILRNVVAFDVDTQNKLP